MYKNLILFRNELKNKSIYKYKVIGIVSEILLSKKIFPKNLDIKPFLIQTLNLELKDYIMKSRTLIVAHLIRRLEVLENEEIYRKELLSFINEKIDQIKEIENIKDEKNDFNGWLK
ncbi:hypothetical protein [Fusobacterium varium]|jgi:hypothetical protein|nr:MAG TPA: hypothetical protein [Caudoviricetes sp.]